MPAPRKKSFQKGLIGTFLCFLIIGSSVGIVFADQDIRTMLTNWFDQHKSESIEEIEQAIDAEQEILIQELKQELAADIAKVKEQMKAFTAAEKEKSLLALQQYKTTLLEEHHFDTAAEKETYKNELESIVQEAKQQMEAIE